jgi:hypothetical protein
VVDAGPEPQGPAASFVDRHIADGATDPFGVVAHAVAHGDDPAVEFVLIDGTIVAASFAGFVAWCLATSLSAGMPAPMCHGVRSSMVETAPGGDAAVLASILTLVPLPAGAEARHAMLAAPSITIPVAAYPLTVALLPEVAHRIVPLDDPIEVAVHPTVGGVPVGVRRARRPVVPAARGGTSPALYRAVRVIDLLPQGLRHRVGNRFPSVVGIRRAALRSGLRSDNPFVRRADAKWLAEVTTVV